VIVYIHICIIQVCLGSGVLIITKIVTTDPTDITLANKISDSVF